VSPVVDSLRECGIPDSRSESATLPRHVALKEQVGRGY